MPKPDRGHELTEELLKDLEDRIAEEYAQASRDMQKKFQRWYKQFLKGEAEQRELLEAGKITQKEFADWRYRHVMMTEQWRSMQKVLAQDMENANAIALKMTGSRMADVYALNANFAVYQIEHDGKIDMGLTLYNHDTAEYLLKEQRQLMPGPSTKKAAEIAADKSMRWNMSKIQSAVLQGILQGETAGQVAERLRGVAEMNYRASVRYARTMTTNVQNAGRYEAYHRAAALGVKLTIEWMATLDGHTRHEHRMMHGQRREVDEPFEIQEGGQTFKILWPADSSSGQSDAPQSQIWNCRCTLLARVKGHEGNTVKSSPGMGNLSFEEWQKGGNRHGRSSNGGN